MIENTVQLVQAKLPERYLPRTSSLDDIRHKAALLATLLKKWCQSERSQQRMKKKFADFPEKDKVFVVKRETTSDSDASETQV